MSLNPLDPEFQKRLQHSATARFRRVQSYLRKSGENPDIGMVETDRTNSAESRDPRSLSELLADFASLNQVSAPLAVANLTFSWTEIVGEEVAEHVQIADFFEPEGKLLLTAKSTAWATQIRMLTPIILEKISAEIGSDIVKTVEVTGPKPPSWKHGHRSVKGRGPRDTYG